MLWFLFNTDANAEPYSQKCKGSTPWHFLYCERVESKLAECNFSRSCSGLGSERVRVYCQPHCESGPVTRLSETIIAPILVGDPPDVQMLQ